MCQILGTVGFGILLLIFTVPVWLVAKIGLCICSCLPGSCRESARLGLAHLIYRLLNITWWLLITCCFWVCIRTEGLSEMRRSLNKSRGKPRVILVNHSSFFDSVLAVAIMPFCAVADAKTLASSHLAALPLIGTLMIALGHLMVEYKNAKAVDDFSVDKDSVTKIQNQFKDHVRSGNMGTWYPEGRLHPGTGTELQQFKAGGFALTAEIDCEIWCMNFLGCNVFWPNKAAVGGVPSSVGVSCHLLCESSHEFVKQDVVAAGQDAIRSHSLFLATRAQQQMQAKMDEMVQKKMGSVKKENLKQPLLPA